MRCVECSETKRVEAVARMEVIAEVAGLKSDCVFYDPAIGTCPDYSTFRYPDCEGCSTYRSKHAICRAQQ
ncbi:MAG: hypothetical protein WCR70_03810 [Sphaerochaetaceae bacterium]